MKSKMINILIVTICLILIQVSAFIQVKAETGKVIRTSGLDRYATAAQVAKDNWPSGARNVILVTGEGYADAVSSSVLAKTLDAPILLTAGTSLNSDTQSALDALHPQYIYIIGGIGAIKQSIRDELRNDGYNLVELKGDNRYETNAAVANKLLELGVKADNVMLVGGEGFSDALSIAPVAAAKGQILLLGSNDNESMKPILDFVKNNNSKVTVIGTNYIINEIMYKALDAVERVNGGADRFETNLNVLNRFKDDLNFDKLFAASAGANARDDGYADALVASSLAGKFTSPLVLLDKEKSSATVDALNYIKEKVNKYTALNIIGGTGVVSSSIEAQMNDIIDQAPEDSGNIKVNDVSANSLNQIKVEFSTSVDKNTAENISSYQIDGVDLNGDKASAVLQEDNKTVLITLANPYPQYTDLTLSVKNTILDKGLNHNIDEFSKKITLSDISVPIVQSISVSGSNKLMVKFSVPIKISTSDLYSIKVNGQSISNLGLDTSLTKFYDQSGIWADKVELYFNSPLPVGNNKLEIPKGKLNDKFYSAAGFIMQDIEVDFSVDSVNDSPQVNSVNFDYAGNIYITFNRAMDEKSVLNGSYYKINNDSITSQNISFDNGSKDTIIKIQNIKSILHIGANIVSVSSNVRDAYGNKINDNTNISFNITQDTVKPQVTNVSMIDSQTMRVKFNKKVNNIFATNKSNYRLFDSNNIEISNKIDAIKPTNSVTGDNTDSYDIKFTRDNALTGEKYTLKVDNIIDINLEPNVMDEFSQEVNGVDDISPSVTAIVRKADNKQKVVIFFSESMDEASITNPSNYYYVNGNGTSMNMPKDATINAIQDDTGVVISFPSNYILDAGSDDNHVIKIGIANVKDRAQNLLSEVTYSDYISTNYSGGPSLVLNTVKFEYSGDDVKVTLHLTYPLDSLNINDFLVAGESPDGGLVSGNDVILIFKDGSIDSNQKNKINSIKSAGVNAKIQILKSKTVQDARGNNVEVANSTDIAGRNLIVSSDIVYNMLLAPKTNPDAWKVAVSTDGSSSAEIVFDENIDYSILGLYNDDFIFTNERTGSRIDVQSVIVDKNSNKVVYNFYNNTVLVGDKIDIYANKASKIDIRSEKDSSGSYVVYNPTSYDLKIRTKVADQK
ncbi:cell wall-binding repeat-containing protein [Clostridium thailandense]|uniref:cell wall-binding repeat-containing protein n=1 Tax=Clostridium thailandense TaxID=2794346 RepID=UPI0039897DD0